MAILYVKDDAGRIAVNVDTAITAKATNDPAVSGERNASGLVYVKNLDQVAVVVTVGGVPLATIASFTAVATAKDLMSAVHVRVRAYADVEIPPPPEDFEVLPAPEKEII